MASIELSKSIEAVKVHPRTHLPLTEPPTTIPYGGLIQGWEEDGNRALLTYLGDTYQCPLDRFKSALGKGPEKQAERVAAIAVPAKIRWETLTSDGAPVSRSKVPGGWLVASGASIAFIPDAAHEWDGRSLD